MAKGWLEKGYVRFRIKGKKIFEHRYIWKKLNGPIPRGYTIHHINGNRSDNRIENLELLPVGIHISLHKIGKPIPDHVHEARILATKGKPLSAEHRKNISLGMMGRQVSIETRNKISKSLMGHPVSEETRRKISETKRKHNRG